MKEIKQTNNYDMFKKMKGNRTISEIRIKKIKESIMKVGYITSPILVNQNMEIIDGQGRYEALKQLHLPVEYIVQDGIGIKECVAMNINKTNWTSKDYIDSYADRGIQSYVYIRDLMRKFKINNTSIISVALKNNGRFWVDALRNGTTEVTEEEYKKAIEKLEYVQEIRDNFNIQRLDLLIKGILFCTEIEGIDLTKLKEKCIGVLSYGKLPPIPSIDDVMMFLEEVYNRNSKKPTLYIYTEYRKQLEERVARQAKKMNEIYKMYKSVQELDDLNQSK